jgi:tRNA G10  N-methylase Trm11
VEKQSDLTIINDGVFVTRAIQDIESFSERDYGRPGADSLSGMLPPKLARMMINLALAYLNIPPTCRGRSEGGLMDTSTITLLDPFCGSGTILTEALSLGLTNIIGSDISPKAIADTKKNISWLVSQYKLQVTRPQRLSVAMAGEASYKLHESNVLNLSDKLNPASIDLIVTEPYLGKPLRGLERREELVDQARSLAELYLNAFHIFHKLLKPGGAIVMVFPKYKYKNEWIRIEILEKIKKIGFVASDPLTYHRPSQHLAREIWKFKKGS